MLELCISRRAYQEPQLILAFLGRIIAKIYEFYPSPLLAEEDI